MAEQTVHQEPLSAGTAQNSAPVSSSGNGPVSTTGTPSNGGDAGSTSNSGSSCLNVPAVIGLSPACSIAAATAPLYGTVDSASRGAVSNGSPVTPSSATNVLCSVAPIASSAQGTSEAPIHPVATCASLQASTLAKAATSMAAGIATGQATSLQQNTTACAGQVLPHTPPATCTVIPPATCPVAPAASSASMPIRIATETAHSMMPAILATTCNTTHALLAVVSSSVVSSCTSTTASSSGTLAKVSSSSAVPAVSAAALASVQCNVAAAAAAVAVAAQSSAPLSVTASVEATTAASTSGRAVSSAPSSATASSANVKVITAPAVGLACVGSADTAQSSATAPQSAATTVGTPVATVASSSVTSTASQVSVSAQQPIQALPFQHITQQMNAQIQMVHPATPGVLAQPPNILQSLPPRGRPTGSVSSCTQMQTMPLRPPSMTPEEHQHYRQQQFNRSLAIVSQAIVPAIKKVESEIQALKAEHARSGSGPVEKLPAYTMKQQRLQQLNIAYKKQMEQQQLLSGVSSSNPQPILPPAAPSQLPRVVTQSLTVAQSQPISTQTTAVPSPVTPQPVAAPPRVAQMPLPVTPSFIPPPVSQVQHTQQQLQHFQQQQQQQHQRFQQMQMMHQQQLMMVQQQNLRQQQANAAFALRQQQLARAEMAMSLQQSTPRASSRKQQKSRGGRRKRNRSSSEEEIEEESEESMPDTPPPVTPTASASESQSLRRSSRRSAARKKKYVDDIDLNLSDSDRDGEEKAKALATAKEDAVAAMQARGEPVPVHLAHFQNDVSEENANVVDKVMSVRNRKPETGEKPNCADGTIEEYYVKFKNFSYLHCEWASADKLSIGDKRVHQKVKRFWIKRNSIVSLFALDDEEPFNQDYLDVERVLEESIEDGQVTHYLVKWRALPYEESTWELPQDVPELQLQQWRDRNKMPAADPVKPFERPSPAEWRQLEASPEFKNGNCLRDYQLEGVNWLMFRWHHRESCILADEMGLGKTIQTVGFLSQIQKSGISRPFLVIAPLSTIHNWQREFETWTDMNVLVYHGSSYSRSLIADFELCYRDDKLKIIPGAYKFHVIITTYEMILANEDPTLSSISWRAVVIDEAHRLKNRNCKLIEGLEQLQMEHKVLLTGTPLQNNVEELYNLLNFLQPARFHSEAAFMEEFGSLKTERQVNKLQLLLKPMMLRRIKEDVEKNIAPKEETVIEVELTTTQKKFYRAILERNFSFLSRGGSAQNMPSLMNTMMELRKCCNHPFLINGAEERIVGEYCQAQELAAATLRQDQSMKVLIEASGKLVLIDKLLPKLKAGGHKVLIFSQMVRCLDILEDYLRYRRYLYERIDGGVRGNLRQAAIDRFSKPDSDRFVFLLCTRAGGLGINLTAADCCIIFDSDWNPQNDLQAQARCHRIGQRKAVMVYRLITRNSYEREMFDRASMKLGLDKAVLQNITKGTTGGAPSQVLNKKEVEDLLRRGAYGAIMDEDNAADKFCEEDIEQILSRRTQVINIESEGPGSTFAKASFVSDKGAADINVDDPDFWEKWAKKADIDGDASEDQLIIDAPRQRKQTRRFGNDEALEISDFEDLGSDSDAKGQSASKVAANRSKVWSRHECFRVEKNLQTFGWGRWENIAYHPPMIKKSIGPLDAEAMCRAILVYCIQHHHGEEKLRTYAEGLLRQETSLDVSDEAKCKAAKRSKKFFKRDSSEIAMRGYDYLFGLDLLNLFTDERYRKHMQQHANKILTRVKMLHVLSSEVIADQAQAIMDGMPASDLTMDFTLPEDVEPPSPWWDEECDRSLLTGAYKHGYERFSAMRSDPLLCFLDRCGPAPVVKRNRPGNGNGNGGGAGGEDDEENMEGGSEDEGEEEEAVKKESAVTAMSTEADAAEGLLAWPVPMDVNTRLRRLVAAYQRHQKKQEQQQAQKEVENRRKEKHAAVKKKKDARRREQEQKWSNREEQDFLRTVTSFGVVYMADTDSYDWSYFRSLAKLEKKTDDRLTEHYTQFIQMCRVVANIAPDSLENNMVPPITEERAMRALSRIDLLSTIREEVLHHPDLDRHLALCEMTSDVPDWWQCGLHDRSLLVGVARYGLARTEYTVMCDPNLLFGQVLNYAAKELGLPAPTFEPVTKDDGVSSHGEASSNIATSSSRDGNRHGRAASDSKSRVATGGTSLEKADSLQTDHAGAMQINISPDIISHVRWPKERHIVRRLQSVVYTVMHGSWPVESGNTAAGGGGAQYAAAYNEYDPSVYEDDATYSSPEPSDTEEEVVQKKSNIKVKRGDGLKLTFKTSKSLGASDGIATSSPSLSDRSSPAARVSVIHKPTGRKLVGQAAPLEHNLKEWLRTHPDYSVLQPASERKHSSRSTPARGYASAVAFANMSETDESVEDLQDGEVSHDYEEDEDEAWQVGSKNSLATLATSIKKKKVHKKKKSKSKKSKHKEDIAAPPAKKKKISSSRAASNSSVSASAKPSAHSKKYSGEERVSVVNRSTGRKIAGKAAPTLRKLDAWLDRNPGFDVADSWSSAVLQYGALPQHLLSRVPSGTSTGKRSKHSKAKPRHASSRHASSHNGREEDSDDEEDEESDEDYE